MTKPSLRGRVVASLRSGRKNLLTTHSEEAGSDSTERAGEGPDGPFAGEALRKSEWRCTMCSAFVPEYDDCCPSCSMPTSINDCVRAMWDEYNKDDECDHTALNRLIERAADLADPEGLWDSAALSSEVQPVGSERSDEGKEAPARGE